VNAILIGVTYKKVVFLLADWRGYTLGKFDLIFIDVDNSHANSLDRGYCIALLYRASIGLYCTAKADSLRVTRHGDYSTFCISLMRHNGC
jgi:hypothetical protein